MFIKIFGEPVMKQNITERANPPDNEGKMNDLSVNNALNP